MSYESCIHYKFVNTTTYSAIKFQGLEISLSDLKMKILVAKHMNHASLEIMNAQNKKSYVEDSEMIPRNTSVIVKRIPPPQTNHSSKVIIANQKRRAEKEISDRIQLTTTEIGNQQADLYKIEESEDYIFKTMMQQATFGFDLSSKKSGKVFNTTKCYACGQYGHQKDKCPLYFKDSNIDFPRKRPKGIPSTMLEIIPGEKIGNIKMREGVYINRKGDYVIPIVDRLAMEKRQTNISKVGFSPVDSLHFVPIEIQCKLCQRILFDAVRVQCCNNSFCDECIRNYIINNNFTCPLQACGKGEILPDSLVPNTALRKAVKEFHAKIAVEKYHSNPKIVHPSCNDKLLFNLENRDDNTLEDLTPELSLDRCQVLNNSGKFLPIHLKHSCYSDSSNPIAQCKISGGSLFELPPQSGPSQSSQFHCVPFLSEREFYIQQAIYRRKQQLKDFIGSNFKVPNASNTSPIPVNDELIAVSATHKDVDYNLPSQVFNISNAESPSSTQAIEGACSNSVDIYPSSSKLPSSNSPEYYPAVQHKYPTVDSEMHENLIPHSDKHHAMVLDEVSFDPKIHLTSHNEYVRSYQDISKSTFGKIIFDSYSSDIQNSKILDDRSAKLPMKYSPQNSSTDHSKNTVEPAIIYRNIPDDQSDCDSSNNNQTQYCCKRNVCSSISTCSYSSNIKTGINVCANTDGANDSSQSRLQSTVKKVLSTPTMNSSTYSYNHSLTLLIPPVQSQKHFKSSHSNSQSSLDSSSELEEGQIVSSGSGSHCFDEIIDHSKTPKRLTLDYHKRFPATRIANVSNVHEPDGNYVKGKFFNVDGLACVKKTPDRIVVIKPSNPVSHRKHNHSSFMHQPKRLYRKYPRVQMVHRNFAHRNFSRLLMTKTEDQRIVEITTAKKFISKSTMSLLKEKLYKREKIGFT